MRARLKLCLATLLAVIVMPSADAHHSVAMYDNDNLIVIHGTVTRVEWASPHVFVYLTVASDDGESTEWAVEIDAPVLLRRYGWRQDTVEPGDEISFTGGPALSGAPVMRGAIAELADGTQLRVWSRV
jgi:hypothetical protein